MKHFFVFAALVVTAVGAHASLVPVGPVPYSGTGLGAVNTVLTVGGRPIESGCVARGPAGDVIGPAACPPGFPGGDERTGASQTQTRTIAELGLTTAEDLRVVINVNESVGNQISLTNLSLTIYDPVGNILFTTGPFTPPSFTLEHLPGTTVGYVFELDDAQAAAAQLVFLPTNRVGMAISLSGATAGNETVFVADVTAVGTPLFGADLSVVKNAPATAISGTNLTYTINATNAGPDPAADVVLSDLLPAETQFVSLSAPAGWTCATPAVGAGGTVTCSKPSMAVGEAAAFSVTVRLCPEVLCGTAVVNTAAISATTVDPLTANGTSSATTTAQAQADVAIAKSASATAVNPGGTIIYTLTVTNGGPSNSAGTTVTDALPAGFTATSVSTSTGTCSGAGTATINCSLGTIGAAGQCATAAPTSATITITAQAAPAIAPGIYTNTATVATVNCLADPNSANNTATVPTTVPAGPIGADVAITKIAPSTVIAGTNLTYTLTATNSGPDVATNVVVSDPLPAQTRFVSQAAPAGWSCATPAIGATGSVVCSKASMAVAETAVFTTVVRTCPEIACATPLSNTATATTATADPVATNNSATATVTVQAQSDLAISKGASVANVAPGETLMYALNVVNAGPSDSASTSVIDVLPAGFTVVSANTTRGTCSGVGTSTLNCSLGVLGAAGQCTTNTPVAALITLVVQVDAATAPGTVLNTATVATGNCLADPIMANNTATVPTTVGAVVPLSVPTLSEIGVAIFAALLLLAGVYFVRN